MGLCLYSGGWPLVVGYTLQLPSSLLLLLGWTIKSSDWIWIVAACADNNLFSLPTDSGIPNAQPLKHNDNTSSPTSPDVELLYLAAPYINHGLTPPPKGTEVFTTVSDHKPNKSPCQICLGCLSAQTRKPRYHHSEDRKSVWQASHWSQVSAYCGHFWTSLITLKVPFLRKRFEHSPQVHPFDFTNCKARPIAEEAVAPYIWRVSWQKLVKYLLAWRCGPWDQWELLSIPIALCTDDLVQSLTMSWKMSSFGTLRLFIIQYVPPFHTRTFINRSVLGWHCTNGYRPKDECCRHFAQSAWN